jgi:hypothetical protein
MVNRNPQARSVIQHRAKNPALLELASSRDLTQLPEIAGTGFEVPQESTENSSTSLQGNALCGAIGEQNGPIDPELETLVEAWPALPLALKTGIMAMVRAAK